MNRNDIQAAARRITGWRLSDRSRGALTRFLAMALLLGVVSCDTEVVNPGPIQSRDLNGENAQLALVNGAGRALADALNWTSYTSAAIAREIHPAGSTGSFGITPDWQDGYMRDDESNAFWENMHRARFLAEDGLERMLALDPSEQDQDLIAEMYLWAGFTHRLMGETMCSTAIDGGPELSHTIHFDAALAHFNQAATIGTGDVQTAAIAGRASIYQWLGQWANAVADATTVLGTSTSFSYEIPYFDIGDDNQANRIWISTKGEPYLAHSQEYTWVRGYGLSAADNPTGDPRVPYQGITLDGTGAPNVGDAATQCCGDVLWLPELKHDDDDSPIELASSAEMRLILAENELVNNGDWDAAEVYINALRTDALGAGGAIDATNLTEGFTFYMREHAIEMWLESRRLPALRRWEAALGEATLETYLHPLEAVGDGDSATGSHLEDRAYCFPISEVEKRRNDNIS